MDAGVAAFLAGLGGALLGAGATLLGARYSAGRSAALSELERSQTAELSELERSQTAELSELERSQNAYDRARQALLRVHNRRKRMRYRELEAMELQVFLNDLFDAQHALSMVLVACREEQKDTLRKAIHEFDKLVDDLIRRPSEQETKPEKALEELGNVRQTLRIAQDADLAARRR
jgi:hypothetical protein